MTDTTQTQVTGPVDDAIDAEVKNLVGNAWKWGEHETTARIAIATGGIVEEHEDELLQKIESRQAATNELAAKISARLAPRADALIERDVIRASALEEEVACINDMFNRVYEPLLCDRIADRIMALLPRAPMPDDTEQIDDQVQDVFKTSVYEAVKDWSGEYLDAECLAGIYTKVRKDLASLGIRLTYDTTIGGENK